MIQFGKTFETIISILLFFLSKVNFQHNELKIDLQYISSYPIKQRPRKTCYFETKSIAQYVLLVNKAQAHVLVPPPSKQQQTGSRGEFEFVNLQFDTIHMLIQALTAGNREIPKESI